MQILHTVRKLNPGRIGFALAMAISAVTLSGCISLTLGRPSVIHYESASISEDPIKLGRTATVHYSPSSNADDGVARGRLSRVSDGWLVIEEAKGERWVRIERIGDIDYH